MADRTFILDSPDKSWEEWVAAADEAFGAEGQIEARADYFLELVGELDAEDARDEHVARLRIAHIEHWLTIQRGRREKRRVWLSEQLEALAAAIDFGRKKSRDLPHGVLGYRAKRATVEITDTALARTWAEQHCPAAVKERTSSSLTKTEIIELVKTSGIHLDPATTGMRFVDDRDEFYITPQHPDKE